MGHYISDAEGKLTKIAGKNYKAYMPLGMIFASAVMLEEISVKRLDGQSLSITGTYKDFCNWVINQGANVPTCNISTYASEMTTYGQCGKFVINNTSSAQTSGSYTVPAYSIKLPTITEFVASNNGGKELGLAQLDAFKSHTHYLQDYPMVTTAYSGTKGWPVTSSGGANSDGGWLLKQNTHASGEEETRPKNIRYPYYIVVAQGVKPIALADMTKKAEKDGSNLTDADVESWQKKLNTTIFSHNIYLGNEVTLMVITDTEDVFTYQTLAQHLANTGHNGWQRKYPCSGLKSNGSTYYSVYGIYGLNDKLTIYYSTGGSVSSSEVSTGTTVTDTVVKIN